VARAVIRGLPRGSSVIPRVQSTLLEQLRHDKGGRRRRQFPPLWVRVEILASKKASHSSLALVRPLLDKPAVAPNATPILNADDVLVLQRYVLQTVLA